MSELAVKQAGGAATWLFVPLGALATLAGAAAILGQATSGAQPWTDELSDNFVFGKSIPFAMGLGVLAGLLVGRAGAARSTARRKADGAIRRFSPGTAIGHWVIAVGFLLALPTGAWQYLGGILDVTAPIPLYLIYRVHYIGGTLILFATASFLAYWWVNGDRSLLVPRGRWTRHLVGLAHELPRPLGERLATALGLDLKPQGPQGEQFTFYEKVVSFPSWAFVIALITITGLIKAMRYVYPIPGPVLFWSSTLHVAAMVLIAVKVLDHLRYTFARWPLMVAMGATWVSESYVRLFHPGWHRAIEEAEAASVRRAAATAVAGPAAPGVLGGGDR